MRTLESWFEEYGESHQHPTNQLIHKVCVPTIFFSILALYRAIPRMEWMSVAPIEVLNWATLALLCPLVFYFLLSRRLFVLMLAQIGLMLWLIEWIALQGVLLQVGGGLFLLAWAGQFYGHRIEGKKPSFFKDLAFLLIGPLWVSRSLLKFF